MLLEVFLNPLFDFLILVLYLYLLLSFFLAFSQLPKLQIIYPFLLQQLILQNQRARELLTVIHKNYILKCILLFLHDFYMLLKILSKVVISSLQKSDDLAPIQRYHIISIPYSFSLVSLLLKYPSLTSISNLSIGFCYSWILFY